MIARVDALKEAIRLHRVYYGMGADGIARADAQIVEECAELIQAISHRRRGRVGVEKVVEELAHVLIQIELALAMRDISDAELLQEVQTASTRVIKRLTKRLEHDGPAMSDEDVTEEPDGA